MLLSVMPHVHENLHAFFAMVFTAAFLALGADDPTKIILILPHTLLNLKTQRPTCPAAPSSAT